MNYLLFLLPVGLVFVVYMANTWNANPTLFAAQKRERARAENFAAVLTRYFDVLDTEKKGLLTRQHLAAVDGLPISTFDKNLLRAAFYHIGEDSYVAENPWFFGAPEEYKFTPIGHKIGTRKETRTTVYGGMHGAFAVPYDVWVNDYAISREDIASYVDRVNARKALPAQ